MSGIEARTIMEAAVRRELFGPGDTEMPSGAPIDCTNNIIHFESREASRGQFHDVATGQEILTRSDPLRRYGIGVLHSGGAKRGTTISDRYSAPEPDDTDLTWVPGLADNEECPVGPPVEIAGQLRSDEADSDDFDLTDANTFKPSAMAVSFKCRIPAGSSLQIDVSAAYYDKISVSITGLRQPVEWWVRRPLALVGSVPAEVLLGQTNRLMIVETSCDGATPRVMPTTQVYSRPVTTEPDPELRLVTIAVVNQSDGTGPGSALFQVGFVAAAMNGLLVEPYPEIEQLDRDQEEQSIDLLYRKKRTYALGHGCAANWGDVEAETAYWVQAEPLPTYEVVSLTPNVYLTDEGGKRRPVTVSMAELAAGSHLGHDQVETVLDLYETWIRDQEALIPDLLPRFHAPAHRHMDRCREALGRMRDGWALVIADETAQRAFRLANQAMLFQQVRSRLPLREVERGQDQVLRPVGPHPDAVVAPGQGNWRPFQIAFILASLPELVDPSHKARSIVDLIFFPTGGGKTEAYLGASAISLLSRRLRDPDDAGTDTLMRYTLRLLTAQQFLRAASLVCVLEDIGSRFPDELGEAPFGIGIWLGGTSTPNNWKRALEVLKQLRRNPQTQTCFYYFAAPGVGREWGRNSASETART